MSQFELIRANRVGSRVRCLANEQIRGFLRLGPTDSDSSVSARGSFGALRNSLSTAAKSPEYRCLLRLLGSSRSVASISVSGFGGRIEQRERGSGGVMLNDAKLRAARSREQPYRRFGAHQLFLFVQPNGGKLWRILPRSSARSSATCVRRSMRSAPARARHPRVLSACVRPHFARPSKRRSACANESLRSLLCYRERARHIRAARGKMPATTTAFHTRVRPPPSGKGHRLARSGFLRLGRGAGGAAGHSPSTRSGNRRSS